MSGQELVFGLGGTGFVLFFAASLLWIIPARFTGFEPKAQAKLAKTFAYISVALGAIAIIIGIAT